MNINKIKEKVENIFQQHKLTLYDIGVEQRDSENILSILIDESIDMQTLEPIHYEVLDEINDDLPDGYLLELSTAGIERPLRSFEEVKQHIGRFIYLESDVYKGNATIEEIEGDTILFSYFIKGRPKKQAIKYSQIRFIRQAVKF